MNTNHIKIESDALVCIICAAAFIGYALGIQKMVNVIKPHQYNKYSQTNLSELAEFLTSNNMIIDGHDNLQKNSNNSNATTDVNVNSEETKMNVVESIIVEEKDKAEGECQGIKSNKDNEKTNQTLHIKERMLLEVSKSVEIAYSLCDLFIEHDVEMEVHADINTNSQFKSNEALKDAMGYIMGMGFAFKAKPDSFASSCCADKVLN